MRSEHTKAVATVLRGGVLGALLLAVALPAALAEEGAVSTQEGALFEDVHAVAMPKGTYGYRGMPGDIVVLNDGRLLLAYTHMDAQGRGTGAVACKYSADQGRTWGEEAILVAQPQPPGKGRYCHPSFLRLANGHILLSYIYSANTKPLFGHNYYRRSVDDAKTWGDQLIVTPHAGYNIVHNDKLVQLSSGRIVVPAEHEHSKPEDDHGGYVSYTVYSDDNGYSWHQSKNMVNVLPIEAQEPHVVELKDGRLLMLMRSYSGFVVRAYSDDQAASWSAGEPVKELPLPPYSTSALNVKRIPTTGDLLLLRCIGGPKEPARRRTPFASAVSKDDGATWEHERIIAGDPEDDYGYPGLTFLDGLALVVYHQRDGLHVARIGIDWFYAQ